MKTTYRRIISQAERTLWEAGIPEPAADAWLLFSAAFGISRAKYLADRDREVLPAEGRTAVFREWLAKRAKRVPIQHILGETEFCGLRFLVSPAVLIPRADTELLVEAVLESAKGQAGLRVLDVCTGSGCIAISLAKLGQFAQVDALDLSGDALAVARRNAVLNGAAVSYLESDLFAKVQGRYDRIAANPPYIRDDVIESLEPEVRDHEPRMALSGGGDGLVFYRRIAEDAKRYMERDAEMFLEIGYDQGQEVTGLLRDAGYREIRVRRDLSGKDRLVCCRAPLNGY